MSQVWICVWPMSVRERESLVKFMDDLWLHCGKCYFRGYKQTPGVTQEPQPVTVARIPPTKDITNYHTADTYGRHFILNNNATCDWDFSEAYVQASTSIVAGNIITRTNKKLWEGSIVNAITVTSGEVPDLLWDPINKQMIGKK